MTTAEGKTLPSCIELWRSTLRKSARWDTGIPQNDVLTNGFREAQSSNFRQNMTKPLLQEFAGISSCHPRKWGTGWCHLQVPSICRVQVAFYRIIRNRKGMWYWRSWNAITWTFVNFGQQITVPILDILVIEILKPPKSFQITELPTDRAPKFNVSRFTHDRGELSKWVALEVRWLCCRSLATPKSNKSSNEIP